MRKRKKAGNGAKGLSQLMCNILNRGSKMSEQKAVSEGQVKIRVGFEAALDEFFPEWKSEWSEVEVNKARHFYHKGMNDTTVWINNGIAGIGEGYKWLAGALLVPHGKDWVAPVAPTGANPGTAGVAGDAGDTGTAGTTGSPGVPGTAGQPAAESGAGQAATNEGMPDTIDGSAA
jgi:hypothetical protein